MSTAIYIVQKSKAGCHSSAGCAASTHHTVMQHAHKPSGGKASFTATTCVSIQTDIFKHGFSRLWAVFLCCRLCWLRIGRPEQQQMQKP